MSAVGIGRPGNVPADVVIDFDFYNPPGLAGSDVYRAWDRLHNGPDIVWTPHHGGHWILTRHEDIRWAQGSWDLFSHEVFAIPRPASKMVLPPITADPPDHARYRSLLNPAFGRRSIETLSQSARALTIKLTEEIAPVGHCEFVEYFSRQMPITIFLQMAALPLENREQFVGWAIDYLHATDPAIKQVHFKTITDYLGAIAAARIAEPGDDLISQILKGVGGGRFQDNEEIVGMLLVVFLGGLDTVANLLSFVAGHLASHPDHRRQLKDQPDIIPNAVEEYIRRFGLSSTGRLVTRDIEHKGITFKKGDMVMVPINMSSTDARVYENPFEIDFMRANREDHNTFGNGPHRCPGAMLARAELGIFLEEWIKRIPDFEIDPADKMITHSGLINGVSRLPLRWTPRS